MILVFIRLIISKQRAVLLIFVQIMKLVDKHITSNNLIHKRYLLIPIKSLGKSRH
ncbi:protein of unknown function [[Clostridium] ultunense Esp]|uniref:Uncharacterized protein n=1 Tax=[Clostridium] ultunense Esp TaxID=1288971 RepID=A0A1M4PLM9_9FIRM|nr:protein of unknown function [[Clostridium] ultunense Esp]